VSKKPLAGRLPSSSWEATQDRAAQEALPRTDAQEVVLREQVAPKVLAALHKLGGVARLRKARLDKEKQLATLVLDWNLVVLREATVEFRYDIRTRDWKVHTDLYNEEMRRIDPDSPASRLPCAILLEHDLRSAS
jgi:hypothetical protein